MINFICELRNGGLFINTWNTYKITNFSENNFRLQLNDFIGRFGYIFKDISFKIFIISIYLSWVIYLYLIRFEVHLMLGWKNYGYSNHNLFLYYCLLILDNKIVIKLGIVSWSRFYVPKVCRNGIQTEKID